MKQSNKTFYTLLFILLSVSLYGQSSYDSTYIWDRRNQLNVSLFLENKTHVISFIDTKEDPVILATNNALVNPGIQATYKWLNIRLKVPIQSWQSNVDRRGNTDNFALAVGVTHRNWWARAYYEFNEGYYSSDLFNLNTVYKHPNFEITQFNFNFDYAFNGEKYSQRQTLWQSEVQLKSAGTFFVGATFSGEWVNNDSLLLPQEVAGDFGVLEKMHNVRFFYPGVHAGYAYTYVPAKGWNITIYGAPGIGAYYGSYKTTVGDRVQLDANIALLAELNGLIGYSGRNWYTNLSFNQYGSLKYLDNEHGWFNLQSYIRIGFGYRFNIPQQKWLKPFEL